MKVLTVIGTRPEFIKLSIIIKRLDDYTNQIIVHTGQNFDNELNELIWQDLSIRKPDFFWNINSVSVGNSVGEIIRKSEQIMLKEKPDALLVLGDTNSCLSAYMAKRMHIPIFHMEAGNRGFDFNVPEEVNRRIIDHIADFNLVSTEHARRHLLSEGLQHRRIYFTGSPMKEVLDYYKPKIEASDILKKLSLKKKEYFLVSIHREENVDNPDNLQKIITALNQLAEKYNKHIIVSTHPRTRKYIETDYISRTLHNLIQSFKPFGFFDYVNLQMNALCTISDSGTISEESAIMGFPAISIRQSMERPEAQDAGTIILTGFEPNVVFNAIDTVIKEFKANRCYSFIPEDYLINNTSWRVVKLILGNTKLSNKWWGINE